MRAHKLEAAGIRALEELARADADRVAELLGVSHSTAERYILKAGALLRW